MSASQPGRSGSYIPPSSLPLSAIPRKRNLSTSSLPTRPPPALRNSTPTTPQAAKEEEDDDEADGKDDYGDIGVINGEHRDEESKEERERLRQVI